MQENDLGRILNEIKALEQYSFIMDDLAYNEIEKLIGKDIQLRKILIARAIEMLEG